MGRYYHLTKKISEEAAAEILRELKELDNVKNVEFTEELQYLKVETNDGRYQDVMNRAVNICRRIGGGCDLSFARFAYDD